MHVSENWIYPQITQVPDTEARVLCIEEANLDQFPLAGERLLTDRPLSASMRARRLADGIMRRLGRDKYTMHKAVRKRRPDLLHAHFGRRGLDGLELKRRLRIPLVTSFYGADAWKLRSREAEWREKYRPLFAEGDAFLVEGPAMQRRLVDLGCPQDKILIRHIGVDMQSLPFRAPDLSGRLKVALVGRFVEKKGLADGVRACIEAAESGVDLEVTVIGDGVGEQGTEVKRELQRLATAPAISGKVTLAGLVPVRELVPHLQQHHLFLCPSVRASNGDAEGGSPVVLTQAMALGLICVGTNHCDIPEVVRHEETGFLIESRDIGAMAKVLIAVSRGEVDTAAISRAGRRHIETNYSLDTQLAELSDVYKRVARSRVGLQG